MKLNILQDDKEVTIMSGVVTGYIAQNEFKEGNQGNFLVTGNLKVN